MKISAAESRIMEVLWRSDRPLAVEDVAEALAQEADWTEGTVRTLMTRLKKKKAVAATKEGRRLFYRALVRREAWLKAESENFIDRVFDGHLPSFMAAFTDQRKLSPEEIEELKRLIERLDHGR